MKKLLGILVVFVGLFVVGCNNNTYELPDALKFKDEYESLNGKYNSNKDDYPVMKISGTNMMKYATVDEVIDIIKNGTGIIYFGLIDVASANKISKIYYLNIHDLRDEMEYRDGKIVITKESTEDYKKLFETLDSILDDYTLIDEDGQKVPTGEKRIYAPTVIFVKDGKIIGTHIGTVTSQSDPYKELTNEQLKELKDIFDKLIKSINE